MLKRIFWINLIVAGVLGSWTVMSISQADEASPAIRMPDSAAATLAVMPFFSGKWQPEEKTAADRTLACSVAQICRSDPNIRGDADRVVTAMVYEWLGAHFPDRLTPFEKAVSAYHDLSIDSQTDTPRSLAMALGEKLGVNLVLVGTVWRFRERGALENIPDSPAAVAFAMYLVDVKTGQRTWRGVFDMAQNKVTDNLGTALQHARLGIRWLSADELARAGVEQIFRDFPL